MARREEDKVETERHRHKQTGRESQWHSESEWGNEEDGCKEEGRYCEGIQSEWDEGRGLIWEMRDAW